KEALVDDLVEVLRAYAERPLEAPVELALKVPAGTEEVRLVYERLSFDEVHEVPAVLSDGIARAVIPQEHTTQPGIDYHWVVIWQGKTLTTPQSYVPFFEGAGPASYIGEWVAHDIEKAGGNLPDGYYVASGQGRLPHDLSASVAPVTSKLLELRKVDSVDDVHPGVDFGIGNPQNVYAMEAGVAYKESDPTGFGTWVNIKHAGGHYYSHYGHLSAVYISDGEQVSQGQLIGRSGDTGSGGFHLDAGYDYYANGKRIALYPLKYFLASYGTYLSTDFDFIQTPTNGYSSVDGSYTNVKVEAKGSSGGSVEVYINYRQKGTSTWTEASVPLHSGITYRYYWDDSLAGKTMEYWIRVERSLVNRNHWATRPAKYDGLEPDTTYHTYYEITVQAPGK
ncbi:MAG: M23 family metallopeptidase, partial [Firmicutes bacterium]|nr:M23 family metallopeptidase [Bacillota bacterium]